MSGVLTPVVSSQSDKNNKGINEKSRIVFGKEKLSKKGGMLQFRSIKYKRNIPIIALRVLVNKSEQWLKYRAG